MKKMIISALIISMSSNAMEQIIPTSDEWNAKLYAKGNFVQEFFALQIFNESHIDFSGKHVLDVGCGTGNISAIVAQKAQSVHGIDASKNMIEYAQAHYGTISNVSFEHCPAENYHSSQVYDIAFSVFCLHWIKDKIQTFKNINKCLQPNGEFLCTIFTKSNFSPYGTTILQELLTTLQPNNAFLQNITLTEEGCLQRYVVDDEQCKQMLEQAGFEVITYKPKKLSYTFKNRKKLEKFQRATTANRPLFQNLPEPQREWLFEQYFDLLITKSEKDSNNHLVFPGGVSTVVHARKK